MGSKTPSESLENVVEWMVVILEPRKLWPLLRWKVLTLCLTSALKGGRTHSSRSDNVR